MTYGLNWAFLRQQEYHKLRVHLLVLTRNRILKRGFLLVRPIGPRIRQISALLDKTYVLPQNMILLA